MGDDGVAGVQEPVEHADRVSMTFPTLLSASPLYRVSTKWKPLRRAR